MIALQHLSCNDFHLSFPSTHNLRHMLAEISHERFRLFPFRSPLLREWANFARTNSLRSKSDILFLFLWLLRCFTSPGFLPLPMYSVTDHAAFPARGFPIRTSSDQRLLATSPGLIAGCYVLHRHVLSSHSPYALMLYDHCKITSASSHMKRRYVSQ